MRFNLKNISLILLVILTIGLLAACTPQEPSQDIISEDLTLNVGFSESKSIENDKNYISIAVNGDSLKLEVENQDIFDSLNEDEFYMFSYNEDDILRDIQTDSYLKDIVIYSMEQGIDEDHNDDDSSLKEITAEDTISLDGLTILDEYIFDFNQDGFDEKISMYVAADRGPDGEIMWDDGQRWVLVVHGDNRDYLLYDDYLQLGSIQFNVFTQDDDFYIVTKNVGTANLMISQYAYDETSDSFIETLPYATDGNVNMFYSSN